ncbi:hypothetical protein FHS61_001970 [Altererythrobacter atlanticus]|uniref:hypothetical protein n=1 Tax=Croceibacterium atlanticum TaxID=1267766 RepID=UPI0012E2D902|nr:hypothetical protein [Croceibacterium atlanticum]MBB5732944.1 hypothetical protein [Croceibacterium atlanticum]
MTIDKRTAEQASTSLWRPFQPGLADKPIGGPRHYVLPHLAMQAGQQLYDLRMNYEFMHFQEPGDTDYAAIMHRYVDIEVPGIAASTTQQQGQ